MLTNCQALSIARWILAVYLPFCLAVVVAAGDISADDRPFAEARSEQAPTQTSQHSQHELRAQIDALWAVTWERFYLPRTQIFYDYLSSYESGRWLAHLPTAEEVRRQHPNECGYDTGMEDGMISAGVILSLIMDRYAITREETLRQRAVETYQGIRSCASIHGERGFVARAICPEDASSVYPNSSRDQYTHAVHGLWLFANSPLCKPEWREEIGETLSWIADRMERHVTAENNYDSLRLDGSRDTRGISRMWNVQPHEAARLPMIYAAAWDITKNHKYRRLYERCIDPAIEQSRTIDGSQPTYALLQVQASLELLRSIEPDEERSQRMRQVMLRITELCAVRARAANDRAVTLDLTQVGTDWRTGEGLSPQGEYRKVWYCIRESGEAALSQCMLADSALTEEQQGLLDNAIMRLDPKQVSSCGIFYLQAAYWKSRRASQ
ncbi:MAG: hypothetical protein ACO1RT_10805 [Planctomycetaceae bacterium]